MAGSTIPSAILDKMRPSDFAREPYLSYFRLLEQVLVQVQEQAGVVAGELSGQSSLAGISPALLAQRDSVGYVAASSNIETKHSVIVNCMADLSVTLNPQPDDGETVYIYNNNNDVDVVSTLPTIGPDGCMGGVSMMSAFRYNLDASAWISLSLSARHIRSEKVVYTASDFDIPARSDVTYVIDGVIDMGSQSIVVGAGGLSIRGVGFGTSLLTSSENNYTLFTSDFGGSGDIELRFFGMSLSGSNSSYFGVTDSSGLSAVEAGSINFSGGASLGYIDGYRQLFCEAVGIFGLSDGLEFRSAWSGGAKFTNLIVRSFGSSGTLFKAGSGLVFNSRFYCDGNIDLPAGTSSVADFAPSNFAADDLLQMADSQITRAGAFNTQDVFYFPNTSAADLTSLWRGNAGLPNTLNGGFWLLTAEATTTIAVAGTKYKLAGTTTYSDLVHFTGAADNAYTMASSLADAFDVIGSVSINGTAGDLVTLYVRQWDDSASSYIDVIEITQEVTNYVGPDNRAQFNILTRANMSINDRIELWVSVNNTNDVYMEIGSTTRIRS